MSEMPERSREKSKKVGAEGAKIEKIGQRRFLFHKQMGSRATAVL